MNKKQFTYKEFKKLMDDENVLEIKLEENEYIYISKKISALKNEETLCVHKLKKFDKLTEKSFKKLVNQYLRVSRNMVKNNGENENSEIDVIMEQGLEENKRFIRMIITLNHKVSEKLILHFRRKVLNQYVFKTSKKGIKHPTTQY